MIDGLIGWMVPNGKDGAIPVTVESQNRLLEPGELAEQGPSITRSLPLELIDPNPSNPRQVMVEIDMLAQNIKQFGLLQPVTVRRQGDRYELLGGHRRRLAYLMLREQEPYEPRWRTIEAVIRTADDDSATLMLISAQAHSRAWAPREEASILEDLARTRTLPEVGKLVNKSEQWVGKRLKVYADSVLSGYVQSGQLATSIAEELRLVSDPVVRREMAERAVAEGWGQAEARQAVRALRADRMVSQIGRLASDLLAALALVQPGQIPLDTAKTLASVRNRILLLGRGAPVMPTIEQAEKAAGVTTQAKQRRTRLKIE